MQPNNLIDNIITTLRERFGFLLLEESWRNDPEHIREVERVIREFATIQETRQHLYDQIRNRQRDIRSRMLQIENLVREHDATLPELAGGGFLDAFDTYNELRDRLQLNEQNAQDGRERERIGFGATIAAAAGGLEQLCNFIPWLNGLQLGGIVFAVSWLRNWFTEGWRRPRSLNNILQRIQNALQGTTLENIRDNNHLLQLIRNALVRIQADEVTQAAAQQALHPAQQQQQAIAPQPAQQALHLAQQQQQAIVLQPAQQTPENQDARAVQIVNALIPAFRQTQGQNNNTELEEFQQAGTGSRFRGPSNRLGRTDDQS